MFVWKTRRQHPWLSVISAHPGDFLTAFKRLTILVTLLFNNMTVVILLLDQDLKLPLASPEFSRVILTTFLAFPIPFIISWILQRAPPLYFYIDLSEDFPLYGFLPLILAIVSDADTAVKDQVFAFNITATEMRGGKLSLIISSFVVILFIVTIM